MQKPIREPNWKWESLKAAKSKQLKHLSARTLLISWTEDKKASSPYKKILKTHSGKTRNATCSIGAHVRCARAVTWPIYCVLKAETVQYSSVNNSSEAKCTRYRHDCHMLFASYRQNAMDFTPNGPENSLYGTPCTFRQFSSITTAWQRTSVVGFYRLQLF